MENHENIGTVKDLVLYRVQTAKDDLSSARILLRAGEYKGANNRAYYAIFYAIRAVLALEQIDFKKHKDVIAYFNQNYIKTEIFPRKIGKKIAQAQRIREDSDYDDEYQPSLEKTEQQIETAKELIKLVKKYLMRK